MDNAIIRTFQIIKEFIHTAPTWVIILFSYLMIIAIKNIKPQKIAIWKLFILPVISIFMQITNIIQISKSNFILTNYLVFLILYTLIIYYITSRRNPPVDATSWSILSPGGYRTLIQILLIFGIKYYFGYKYETQPNLAKEYMQKEIFILLIINGALLGRAIFCLFKIIKINNIKNFPLT